MKEAICAVIDPLARKFWISDDDSWKFSDALEPFKKKKSMKLFHTKWLFSFYVTVFDSE